MAIENFKHLIEAQSLEKKMREHLDAIDEQKNRISHLKGLRTQASVLKEEIENLKKELADDLAKKEKELFDAESKVEKTNEHIPLARNEQEANALQKELESLNPLIEELQEKILELMDEIENLESQLNEKNEFLKGSQNTLKEISNEVEAEIQKEQSHIDSLEERVSSLLDQAGEVHKTAYLLSNEKHKFNDPLCFVESSACHVCRFTLNQMQANEIEKGEVTESCPGCGRLLTPLSAKTL